jgi:hypothetical protein
MPALGTSHRQDSPDRVLELLLERLLAFLPQVEVEVFIQLLDGRRRPKVLTRVQQRAIVNQAVLSPRQRSTIASTTARRAYGEPDVRDLRGSRWVEDNGWLEAYCPHREEQ